MQKPYINQGFPGSDSEKNIFLQILINNCCNLILKVLIYVNRAHIIERRTNNE